MRLTYLDDAGLFNSGQEPFIVAGGVMIDADRQMIAVEEHLAALVTKYIPEEDRDGFIFHAMELWSGSRYFKKHKDAWPLDRRMDVLRDLAAMPETFDLAVCWGFHDRELIPRYNFPESLSVFDRERAVYADVISRICDTVESVMRECFSDEVTILICEDRDSVRAILKEMHSIYRDPKRVAGWSKYTLANFPFHHIRDTIHFAKKQESAHLQLADTCTFILKKRLEKNEHARDLYAAIKPRLLSFAQGEDPDAVSW